MAALVSTATPVGDVLRGRICVGLEADCGGAAGPSARGEETQCLVSDRSRLIGYHGSYMGVRVDREDGDVLSVYGDGAGEVVMSQGAGAGVTGSTKASGAVGYDATALATGDVALVHSFPVSYGGGDAAQAFVDDERDVVGTAVDIVVPGAQAADEGLTRAGGAVRRWWDDDVLPSIGAGPSAQVRERRDREQRAVEADAVEVHLAAHGSAGMDAGAGRRRATGDGEEGGSPAEVGLGGDAEVEGVVRVGLHSGEEDSVPSSFSGSVSVSADGSLTLGPPDGSLPPFVQVAGQAGADGSYTVALDEDGEPASLTVLGSYTLGGEVGLAPPPLPGAEGEELTVDVGTGEVRTVERTFTLDLSEATSEGRANRTAFDAAFVSTQVSVDDSTAAVYLPVLGTPTRMAELWAPLAVRVADDAVVVDATYSVDQDGGDFSVTAAGTGVGGGMSESSRSLVEALVTDNRLGGGAVPLASCGG